VIQALTRHRPHLTPQSSWHDLADRTKSTSVLRCIPTTVGVIITARCNTTIRLPFDLSRPVGELLHELGYLGLDLALLCSHDRADQCPRRRYTDTLLDCGLTVGIDNVVTIVRISNRQLLLGGPHGLFRVQWL
jgi:hypothetical protein